MPSIEEANRGHASPTAVPKSFEGPFPGVEGHLETGRRLQRALKRKRLHHALILEGPRGVGKTTFSRGLACALFCQQKPYEGCGECSDCRRVLHGRHRDVTFLRGRGVSNNISAEDARNFTLSLQHAPFEAPAHLAIIDPADRMHPAAAAALLKTIEEPPNGVYFALLVQNPGDLLDTIRSRCLSIPFARLPDASVQRVLDFELAARQQRQEIEKPEEPESFDPSLLPIAIQLSDGRPGIASEWLHDPSLGPLQELLRQCNHALQVGPPAIFSGDKSALWQAWSEAMATLPDPEQRQNDDQDDEPEVVVVKGSKKKVGRKKKTSRKKSGAKAKETPARQRELLHRLSEIWILHLRNQMSGQKGVVEENPAPPMADLLGRMRGVQTLQRSLARNPNARLLFEQTLLENSNRPTSTANMKAHHGH